MRGSASIGPSREGYFPEESRGAENMEDYSDASFWQQLKASIVRNLLRKMRNKKQVFRVSII